jgi:hypothetical protein
MTFFRLVYAIASSNIHPSLVINADQTMIHLVPGGNQRTYEQEGSKQVSMHGLEEKRGFTSLLYVQQLKIRVISFHLIPAVTGAV